MPFDAIVIGLGGLGSAAAYHLARRGARVLGLEQFSLAHRRGGSHGGSRPTRRSCFGRPELAPLLHRSHSLWADLERNSERQLFTRTGLLIAAAPPAPGFPRGVERAAATLGVAVEPLTPAEARRAFPQVLVPDRYLACYEPSAGYLAVELAIEVHCRLATARGAVLLFREDVRSFSFRGRHVEVVGTRDTYRAGALVIAAGPWSGRLLASLEMPVMVRRVPQLWFAVGARHSAAEGAPCFSFELPHGSFHGVPATHGGRMKICRDGGGRVVPDPAHLDQELRPEDRAGVRRFIADFVPGVDPEPVAASISMSTTIGDDGFLVDRHPGCERVVITVGFSGHAFQLTPAIGELCAELALSPVAAPPEPLRLRKDACRGNPSRVAPPAPRW